MGKAFWTSWALWEKMCFVLGAAIILTILAGCLKLWWSSWRLRKYTAIDAAKRTRLEEVRKSQDVLQLKGNEIPFGVRAIESGIQVDGVWISRSNSPGPGNSRSAAVIPIVSAGSSDRRVRQPKRDSAGSNMSHLSIPQPAYGQSANGSSQSSNSSRAPSSSFDRAVSAERLPRSSEPMSAAGPNGRYRPRHYSHLRYSGQNMLKDQTTLDSLEGYAPHAGQSDHSRRDSDGEGKGRRASNSSSDSSDGRNHYYPQRPSRVVRQTSSGVSFDALSNPVDVRPFIESRRSDDLAGLHSQRISHAAETGQLVPRVRRSGVSGEWASMNSFQPSKDDKPDHLNNSRLAPINGTNPFVTPTDVSATRRIETDGIAKEFPLQSSSSNEPKQSDMPSQGLSVIARETSDANQQLRQSRTVRKVNSGFEVLPPGTFPVQGLSDRGNERSEDWNEDLEAGGRRHSRRLQKKRRSESITRRSIDDV
ncbi:MAG: hypothetical protein M1827_006400 [Pycnora praestabilis]|nr:MAG: hypothetical protein M1827_006400 [Pycnora praestabilis]